MSIESFPVASGGSGTVTSVAGGEGITNTPDPIVGTGTVDLDINSLTTETVVSGDDLFAFVDVSVGTAPADQRKATLTNMRIGAENDGDPYYNSWDQYQGAGGASTAIIVVGHSAASVTASTSAGFQDATGAYVNLNTTAGIADTNATYVGPSDHSALILNPTWGCTMKTGADIADQRNWFIFGTATPYASDDPAISMVGFRGLRTGSVAGVNDTNWQAVSKDGVTQGVSDTGVAIVADTRYVFRVDCTATTANYYIDDVLVATRTTNLPTSTTSLAFFLGLRSRVTAAKSWRFRKTWLRQL